MLQAMYNGVSAITATQTNMDVIGNNIANVNTDGFKASTVSFASQLSDTIQSGSGPELDTVRIRAQAEELEARLAIAQDSAEIGEIAASAASLLAEVTKKPSKPPILQP